MGFSAKVFLYEEVLLTKDFIINILEGQRNNAWVKVLTMHVADPNSVLSNE